jgi:hypothetical protein
MRGGRTRIAADRRWGPAHVARGFAEPGSDACGWRELADFPAFVRQLGRGDALTISTATARSCGAGEDGRLRPPAAGAGGERSEPPLKS